MLGDWLEAYATALECNVWTEHEFRGALDTTRRAASGRRAYVVPTAPSGCCIRATSCSRTVSSANPRCPTCLACKDFKGKLVHAQGFDSGAPWHGKNVLVLGVGNSAHDIAQDLHGHGAKVKMIQRGSISVFSVKAASINHSIYYNEGSGARRR